jgi:hypothetical protein
MERRTKRHSPEHADLDKILFQLIGTSTPKGTSIAQLARRNIPGLHTMLGALLKNGCVMRNADENCCAPFWAVLHWNLPLLEALSEHVSSIAEESPLQVALLQWPIASMPRVVALLQEKFTLKASSHLLSNVCAVAGPLEAKTTLISCCWSDKSKWLGLDPLAVLANDADVDLFEWGLRHFNTPTSRYQAALHTISPVRLLAIIKAADNSELEAFAERVAVVFDERSLDSLIEYVHRANGFNVLLRICAAGLCAKAGLLISQLHSMPAWTAEMEAQVRAAGKFPADVSCIAAISGGSSVVELFLAFYGAAYLPGEQPIDSEGYVCAHLSATLSRVLAATGFDSCDRGLFEGTSSDVPFQAPFSTMDAAVDVFCKTWHPRCSLTIVRLRTQLRQAVTAAIMICTTGKVLRDAKRPRIRVQFKK